MHMYNVQVISMVTQGDPDIVAFFATMDSLNKFLRDEAVPPALSRRAREYFVRSKHLRFDDKKGLLLSAMPTSMRDEFVLHVSQVWRTNIWFLGPLDIQSNASDRGFVVDFARSITARVFAPGDLTTPGIMYIIHRGTAFYGTRVVSKGHVFGDDYILSETNVGLNRSSARALTYLEVYMSVREEVLALGDKYPETYRKVRRLVVFRALRKALLNKRNVLFESLEAFRTTQAWKVSDEAAELMYNSNSCYTIYGMNTMVRTIGPRLTI